MFLGISYYRIPAAYGVMRYILEQRGTRIDGSRAGPGAPRIFLNSDPKTVEAIRLQAEVADATAFGWVISL